MFLHKDGIMIKGYCEEVKDNNDDDNALIIYAGNYGNAYNDIGSNHKKRKNMRKIKF